ncbi:MAG: hypothetical protein ACPGYY_00250 [Bacteroidia bacterium]
MERTSFTSRFTNFINTYSIWVALGSFSTFLFVSQIYKVDPNYIIASGLALGVWFIYTLDHLLDGIKLKGDVASPRHREHFEKKKVIVGLLILVAAVLLILATRVPKDYYPVVQILFGLTVAHFLINYLVPENLKRKVFLKEVFIALVVTIGFVFTPFIEVSFKHQTDQWMHLFFIFCLINLSNLLLFSAYDRNQDKLSQVLSIAQLHSKKTIRFIIVLCLVTSVLLVGFYTVQHELKLMDSLILLAMQTTLALMTFWESFFSKGDRYRFWGDFIYVYPLFVLPFLG